MNEQYVTLARKKDLTKKEWDELIAYVGDDVALALAARIFYCLNEHTTHPFDYFVPNHPSAYKFQSVIQSYIKRARYFVRVLSANTASEDVWYLSATLVSAVTSE